MLQAVIDENNVVISVNDWDPGVGIPCDEFTQYGMLWNGSSFVRHPDDVRKELVDAVQLHLDQTVRTRNYDSMISCCSYANSGVTQFATEAAAAIIWRDAVWVHCYQVLVDVNNNLRPTPTTEELISELPTIGW